MSNRYRELSVELGERSYPIFIGEGLLGTQDLSAFVSGAQVMIVTNETVAPLYLERAKACFPGKRVDTVVLPDGEKFKDWQTLNSIFDGLLEHRHTRKTTLVALGERQGQPWFMVFYGEFPTREAANAAAAGLPGELASRSPWVRPVDNL